MRSKRRLKVDEQVLKLQAKIRELRKQHAIERAELVQQIEHMQESYDDLFAKFLALSKPISAETPEPRGPDEPVTPDDPDNGGEEDDEGEDTLRAA